MPTYIVRLRVPKGLFIYDPTATTDEEKHAEVSEWTKFPFVADNLEDARVKAAALLAPLESKGFGILSVEMPGPFLRDRRNNHDLLKFIEDAKWLPSFLL